MTLTSVAWAVLFTTVFAQAAALPESVRYEQKPVLALGKRTCLAHLWMPRGIESQSLVFYMTGNGIYTLESMAMPALLEGGLVAKKFAVLTLDKPGLKALASAKPEGADVQNLVFVREKDPKGGPALTGVYSDFLAHTQRDLVHCAGEALEWALMQPDLNKRSQIVFRGTSEGAEILSRLYEALLTKKSPLAKKVRALMLMSPPIDRREKIFKTETETPENKRYFDALKKRDSLALIRDDIVPFGVEYIEEFRKEPSMDARLLRLASNKPGAAFHIFYGTQDFIANSESMERLAKRNRAAKNPLKLTLHAYEAKHFLNPKAGEDVAREIDLALALESDVD